MKLDLKEWIKKVSNTINTHFFTNKTATVKVASLGKSLANGYVNCYFPIPYTPETYTATLTDISIVNVGSGTVANYYELNSNFIYVRINASGLTNGTSYLVTAKANLVVGG